MRIRTRCRATIITIAFILAILPFLILGGLWLAIESEPRRPTLS